MSDTWLTESEARALLGTPAAGCETEGEALAILRHTSVPKAGDTYRCHTTFVLNHPTLGRLVVKPGDCILVLSVTGGRVDAVVDDVWVSWSDSADATVIAPDGWPRIAINFSLFCNRV